MRIIRPELCLKCKGRLWCGLNYCPILLKKKYLLGIKVKVKDKIEGFSYGFFAGWRGYPKVNVGIFSSEENLISNPKEYLKMNIFDVAKDRISMILGRERKDVKEVFGLENKITEVAGSKKNVYVFVSFKEKPRIKLEFSYDYYPIGPRAMIKEFELLDEPKISRVLEKIYYDEIKAEDSVWILYKKGFSEYKISEVFSAGFLGKNKRIVPTRWSITAVDSILSRKLKERVIRYDSIEKIYIGEGNLFGNYIKVFLLPGGYSFEFIEIYDPNASWNITGKTKILRDYEFFNEIIEPNTAGAYFAARLAVLEYLNKIKRKAKIIVFRMITKDYIFPLGVWVVREAVRKAIMNLKEVEDLKKFEILKFSKTIKQKELQGP